MPESPVLAEAERFRARLLREERETAAQMVRVYGQLYRRLQSAIKALTEQIAGMEEPGVDRVRRLGAYQTLLNQVETELGRFGAYAQQVMAASAAQGIEEGLVGSARLVELALPAEFRAEVMTTFTRLPVDMLETMAGFLSDESPLREALIHHLGPEVAERVADAIQAGVGMGFNPRKIAREIVRQLGLGLVWTLRTVRTAQLWGWRTASLANYRANAHIVKGWTWHAHLGDKRTCMGCIAMHGSVHGLDEVLNDHHNGRCAMVPLTVGWEELGLRGVPETRVTVQPGEEWFKGLDEAEQRERMGSAMFAAWKAGEFRFGDLVREYDDAVYGRMRREASLREILGDEKAKRYYRR